MIPFKVANTKPNRMRTMTAASTTTKITHSMPKNYFNSKKKSRSKRRNL